MTTIIVVDDQASNRRIMAKLAAAVEENVEVMPFGDPLRALACAENKAPDLLITDYMMKPFNGDEFIRRFRGVKACAEVPAVVVTAYQDVEFRDRAVEAGSTDFLLSPLNHRDFLKRSRNLLAVRAAQKLAHRPVADFVANGQLVDKAAADAQIEMTFEMLQTVNSHLTTTLADLNLVTNDLRNLVEITQVAAVFVDGAHCVRRFTPAVTPIFNLKPSDIGRPLADIPVNLDYRELDMDFRRIEETEELLEKYLETFDGRSQYLMRMLPYRRDDGQVDGAAITFTKVGETFRYLT